MTELAEWDSFYVIAASAAGGLIGLQFVVMTLLAESPPRGAAGTSAAFATPTIVHFSTVLLLGAMLRAPWRSINGPALLLGLVGFAGVLYAVNVVRRIRVQTAYQPEMEDWIFHVLLPVTAYALIALSAGAARSDLHHALFGVGSAALLLLFTGIHNAWDAVAYHVLVTRRGQVAERSEGRDQSP